MKQPKAQKPQRQRRKRLARDRIGAIATAIEVAEDADAGVIAEAGAGLLMYRQARRQFPSRSFRKRLPQPHLKAPRQNLNRLRRQPNLNLRKRKARKLQSDG